MDFWLLAGRLARRWYLTVPLAVVAVVISLQVSHSVRTSYSTETQVLLVPGHSVTPTGTPAGNPLMLANSAQMNAATQSVLLLLRAPDLSAVRQARQPEAEVRFDVVQDAPIIKIAVSAPESDTVHDAAQLATQQLDEALAGIQRPLGTAIDQRISTVPLAAPTIVDEHGDERRVLIGALVAGALAVALLVLAADQVLRRRLERRLTPDLHREVGRITGGQATGPQHRSG